VVARFSGGTLACAPDAGAATGGSPLWLNVSPIWPGHCLFTPRVEEGHPQVATPLLFSDVAVLVDAMGAAEDAEAGAGGGGGGAAAGGGGAPWSPAAPAGGGFFAGFNSLGAHASVNHFHAHTGWAPALCHGGAPGGGGGWAAGEGLPCQRAPLTHVATVEGLALFRVAWHVPGFLLAWGEGGGGSGAAGLGRAAGSLCAWLAARGAPHNVVFARAPSRGAPAGAGAPAPGALTIAVFPRTPQRESFGGGMGVALAEVAGLAICTEPGTWEEMDGARFARELAAVGLPAAEFEALAALVRETALPAAAAAARPAFLAAAAPAELEARAAVWGELVWALPFQVGRDISQRVRDEVRGGAAEDAVGLPPNDTVRKGGLCVCWGGGAQLGTLPQRIPPPSLPYPPPHPPNHMCRT
jgi:hypothetical protein